MLKNKGNLFYNKKVLQSKKGSLIFNRRLNMSEKVTSNDYLSCKSCFIKKKIFRQSNKCKFNDKQFIDKIMYREEEPE